MVRDAKGDLHTFRPLTMAELIEVERRIGGSLATHGRLMTYLDALFILASALDMKECDVLPVFDGPTSAQALVLILGENLVKPVRKGSLDDEQF